jgi:hypothetical protein
MTARPAKSEADMERKIMDSETLARDEPHLYWMAQASIRCDGALIMPDWSQEQVEAWIAKRRRPFRS